MTTVTSSLPATLNSAPINLVRSGFNRLWSFNKLVTLSVLLYLILIPIYLVAAIVDPRLITNAPAFIKPLKFVLSSAIYMATFLWLLTLVQGHKRWVQFAANFTAFAFLVENLIITVQAIRGVPSHFNAQTPFDAALFSSMGILITIVAFLNLLLGIWLLFQRLPDPVIAWSVRLGVFISFAGMIVAFLMTANPTPQQLAQMETGQMPTAIGAHSVGIEDGGPGLPFVGWSTVGGDLRVAHFIGLHGMQILPLLGLALSRRRNLGQRQRLVLILSAGIAYSGWLLLLTWQALRGQSIIVPDALTLAAYAGLGSFLLLMTLVTFTMLRLPAGTPLTPVRAE